MPKGPSDTPPQPPHGTEFCLGWTCNRAGHYKRAVKALTDAAREDLRQVLERKIAHMRADIESRPPGQNNAGITRVLDLAVSRLEMVEYGSQLQAREHALANACKASRAYNTFRAAGEAAKAIGLIDSADLRPYRCPACRKFHYKLWVTKAEEPLMATVGETLRQAA